MTNPCLLVLCDLMFGCLWFPVGLRLQSLVGLKKAEMSLAKKKNNKNAAECWIQHDYTLMLLFE